jgi:ribose 5-phosphate isomerase B
VDYPDFAAKGARAVARGDGECGVFLCGTGIGVSIAANKIRGIRAALVYDETSAEMSRRHNNANVACLGARTQTTERIAALVDLWLATPFDGGRHAARVAKFAQIEDGPGGIGGASER